MSGDLKHPSKAIPKGTLYGLLLTFVSYTVVILAMGASITRASFYNNTNVIQVVGEVKQQFAVYESDTMLPGQRLGSNNSFGRVRYLVFLLTDGCYWVSKAIAGACS